MHSLGLVKTRIDQGLDHGTMRLFPDTLTFLKAFGFSRHFPDFPTYHKIPNFFPISRAGGDPVYLKLYAAVCTSTIYHVLRRAFICD